GCTAPPIRFQVPAPSWNRGREARGHPVPDRNLVARRGHGLYLRASRPRRPSSRPLGPMTDPKQCVVLVPVGYRVEPPCEEGLRKLEDRGYVVRRVYGYSAVDVARNQMASDALADGFEELMWIDADIVFDPDDVETLRAHGLP